MAGYDTREALRILTKAHGDRYRPLHESKALLAAEALLSDVLRAVESAGFTTRVEQDGSVVIIPNTNASGKVWLVARKDGIHLGVEDVGPSQKMPDPVIVYDAGIGQWVGTAPDEFITKAPGEPVRPRSAAAVVADSIVTALAKIP